MIAYRRHRLLILVSALALIALLWSGCGSETVTQDQPPNSVPSITVLFATPPSIETSGTTTLNVVSNDDDGDDLTHTWTADAGQFVDGSTGKRVVWKAPAAMGPCAIVVAVDDGTAAVRDTVMVEVYAAGLNVAPDRLDFGLTETMFEISIDSASADLEWSANCMQEWITLEPVSGSSAAGDDVITVTVDRAGLTAGTYTGVIDLTTNLGDTSVAVTMVVSVSPRLQVTPAILDFGANHETLRLTVENPGTGTVTWSIASIQDWLSISPTSGATTDEVDEIDVTVDRAGLSPGDHEGQINVSSTHGSATVDVKVSVAGAPVLDVDESSLDFGTTTSTRTVTVRNAGSGTLEWEAATDRSWCTVSPAGGSVTTGGDELAISVDRDGLAAGSHHTGMVSITSNGGSAEVVVTVEVGMPVLSVSATNLDFGADDSMRIVTVANDGVGVLEWQMTSTEDWIAVEPASGTAADETDPVEISVVRAGLAAGSYDGAVAVTSNGGDATIDVAMEVVAVGPVLSNLFFLHHSTGRNLINEGDVRGLVDDYNATHGTDYEFWDHDYNYIGLTDPDGVRTGVSYNIPNDNTDPDGLHALWTTSNSARLDIVASHEVIAFKSCYPASAIGSESELQQYKDWYLEIRSYFDQHPDKVFVVMSPPPLHRLSTDVDDADRARAFANWLGSSTYLNGHPNIHYFDFFDHLARADDGSATRNMLRYEYERSHSGGDSHPNATANRAVGPLFVEAMISAAGPGK